MAEEPNRDPFSLLARVVRAQTHTHTLLVPPPQASSRKHSGVSQSTSMIVLPCFTCAERIIESLLYVPYTIYVQYSSPTYNYNTYFGSDLVARSEPRVCGTQASKQATTCCLFTGWLLPQQAGRPAGTANLPKAHHPRTDIHHLGGDSPEI